MVLSLLFAGMSMIVNANNARAGITESRTRTRSAVVMNFTTAEASIIIGYHYNYNRGGFTGRLPRTFFSISGISAHGIFIGNVSCNPNVTGGCTLTQ